VIIIIFRLEISLIIFSCIFNAFIIYMLRKEVLDLRFSLIWVFIGFCMILFAIFPNIMFYSSRLLGIEVPSNAVFFLAILFLMMITFSLTLALSRQSVKVTKMAEKIALLEKKLEDTVHRIENK
jgi:hypothetical protein